MSSDQNKGLFITVDGRHAVGKTFVVDRLAKSFQSKGLSAIATHEPTHSKIGKFAREAENYAAAETLVCLFAADRYHHLTEVTAALSKNMIIICDRYVISSLILQGIDGVSPSFIASVNSTINQADISIILTADNDIIARRQHGRCLSRLEAIELQEGFDRYVESKAELERFVGNIVYFRNNNLCDYGRIERYVCREVRRLISER